MFRWYLYFKRSCSRINYVYLRVSNIVILQTSIGRTKLKFYPMSRQENVQRIEQKAISTNAEIINIMHLLLSRLLSAQSSFLFHWLSLISSIICARKSWFNRFMHFMLQNVFCYFTKTHFLVFCFFNFMLHFITSFSYVLW
jgi:hypothetical protein